MSNIRDDRDFEQLRREVRPRESARRSKDYRSEEEPRVFQENSEFKHLKPEKVREVPPAHRSEEESRLYEDYAEFKPSKPEKVRAVPSRHPAQESRMYKEYAKLGEFNSDGKMKKAPTIPYSSERFQKPKLHTAAEGRAERRSRSQNKVWDGTKIAAVSNSYYLKKR